MDTSLKPIRCQEFRKVYPEVGSHGHPFRTKSIKVHHGRQRSSRPRDRVLEVGHGEDVSAPPPKDAANLSERAPRVNDMFKNLSRDDNVELAGGPGQLFKVFVANTVNDIARTRAVDELRHLVALRTLR